MQLFLWSFCWGLVLLVAFVGWGWAFERLFFRHHRKGLEPWGLAAVVGVAVLIAVGGVLNLLHLAIGVVLKGTVVVGVAEFVALSMIARRTRIERDETSEFASAPGEEHRIARSAVDRIAWVICGVLVLYVYCSCLRAAVSISSDDMTGYFPLAQVMTHTGTINQQHFSERRMLALGGDTVLRSIEEIDGTFEGARLLDPGVALLMLIGTVTAIARRWSTRGFAAAAVPAYLAFVPIPAVNATSTVMLVVFISVLPEFVRQAMEPNKQAGSWVRVGLVAAGAVALKSNVFPVIALFALGVGLLIFVRADGNIKRVAGALTGPAIAVATAVVVLLPWMIGSWQACRTAMYPVLGIGNHHGLYSHFAWLKAPFGVVRKSFDSYERAAIAMLLMWIVARGWQRGVGFALPAVLAAAAVVAAPILAIRLGGYMIYRFQFPFLMAAVIAMVLLLTSRSWPTRIGRVLTVLVMVGLVFTAITVQIASLGGALKSDWANIQTVFAGHRIPTGAPVVEDASKQFIIDPVGLSAEYRAAQSSIPAGEPVLLLAAHAFLWDYQRNPCQIADNAGSASPPPGMPMDNANALAIYLVERGIGYVFVTDVYQSMAGPRDSRDTQPPADRDYITKVLQFQKLVHELAKADAIYEKNGFLVLDLHSADRVGAHSRG